MILSNSGMAKDVLVSFVSTIGRPTDRALSRIPMHRLGCSDPSVGVRQSLALALAAAEKQEEDQRDCVKLWHRTNPPAANYLGRP